MKRIIFFLLFIGVAFSCEKEYYTSIPNYPVNIELRLENMDSELNAKLAYKKITQPRYAVEKTGFGGVLVINGMGENPVNLFAFDLACPVEAQRNVLIVPDNSGITATCPKCGAVFTIANGTGRPESGTKYYLKSYRVIGNGLQYTVTN
ncbi:MAG: (2Fe-2S)-binding protein [Candidatus Azobacteroides sp.]|nr:(2Fe-2S)-binding protein [Candidatus Azobacteroides sp.]